MDVHAAAIMIGYSERWLYNNHKKLSFTKRGRGSRLRFSVKGIQSWIAGQK